eukprot:1925464-Amphidinium_carterae.4
MVEKASSGNTQKASTHGADMKVASTHFLACGRATIDSDRGHHRTKAREHPPQAGSSVVERSIVQQCPNAAPLAVPCQRLHVAVQRACQFLHLRRYTVDALAEILALLPRQTEERGFHLVVGKA